MRDCPTVSLARPPLTWRKIPCYITIKAGKPMADMIADETLGANESIGITNGKA